MNLTLQFRLRVSTVNSCYTEPYKSWTSWIGLFKEGGDGSYFNFSQKVTISIAFILKRYIFIFNIIFFIFVQTFTTITIKPTVYDVRIYALQSTHYYIQQILDWAALTDTVENNTSTLITRQ